MATQSEALQSQPVWSSVHIDTPTCESHDERPQAPASTVRCDDEGVSCYGRTLFIIGWGQFSSHWYMVRSGSHRVVIGLFGVVTGISGVALSA